MSDPWAPSGAASTTPAESGDPSAPPAWATPAYQLGVPVPARRERSRAPIYVALFVVATLSGAALFVSGFTLGVQGAVTPGTAAQNQQLFEPYWEAWNKVTTEYVGEFDRKALVEGSIKGMFDALGDPYSGYMTSEEYRNSLSGISGEFEGVGAEMAARDASGTTCSPIGDTCLLVVVRVLRDSPALRAGLLADDVLLSVDAQSIAGKTVDEIVAIVRGPKDTSVTLGIARGAERLDLTIVRAVIRSEDVRSEVLAGGQVGYLKVAGFSSSSADDFVADLRDFVETRKLMRIILDLRDDPGGFVNQARTIASQFIASGPIYWEETADGRQVSQDAISGGVATDTAIRLVLLVNGGSASASEIVAGALDDTGRATLVGEKTYGKGTVQQWHLLSGDNGGFRLSVAKWLTPNKTWIHDVGITPDVVVPRPADTPAGQDPQLDRAIEILTTGTGVLGEPTVGV